MMPGFVPVPAGSGGPSVSFQGNKTSTAATSTYTFSNCNIGIADNTRIVVIGTSHYRYDTGAALSSVTIGGTTATVIAKGSWYISGGTGSYLYSALAYLVVPAGNTTTVIVKTLANANMCGIGIWSIYNTQNSYPTVYGTSGDTTTAVLSENVVAGDVGVAMATSGYNTTTSWVGSTERFDVSIDSSHGKIGSSGSDFNALSTASPRTITATQSSGSQILGSVAIWR